MQGQSRADHGTSPPIIEIPREYNAAFDLLSRNLSGDRADKCAYIDDEGRYSFSDLNERSARTAAMLRGFGLDMEQRVVVCMHDSFALPSVFLGAIRAGIVPVLVNTLLTADDYAWMLRDSRAQVAIVSVSLLPLFEPLLESVPGFERVIASGAGTAGPDELTALIDAAPADPAIAPTVADDACFWLYSSGSTGTPKGTVHVHSSMIQTAELYARPVLGINENDTVFSAAKLFFAYGLGNALSFPLSVGATTLLMAERPTPAAVFERLRSHRITVFCAVPTLYAALLADSELPAADELNLRHCISAGEPLPVDIARRWHQHFGVNILDGIGSTEMLHIFLSNRAGTLRYGTTGKPLPGYELRIVDDEGAAVAQGEIGELQVSGPTAASMYWNNRDKTRGTFLGEWTRTGDKYRRDEDGFYVFCGRSDDMLKVGGIYVSPTEVEGALITHAAILEAAVVGRADDAALIKPAAYVVLQPGVTGSEELAATLKAHVKSQLAPYKYPRWIEFVSDLPKTATGKIQRFKLRD
ncbi:MAG: benzoate-CoA ligase family protein [Gammaproteobacteria bacterium]|nr:benzoate-CoA ligase family protein [Gammaproteobacteria bacterium]